LFFAAFFTTDFPGAGFQQACCFSFDRQRSQKKKEKNQINHAKQSRRKKKNEIEKKMNNGKGEV
jgi:hypothetical protein